MNNIVNDALALVDKINEQIRVIEGCNITKGHMTGAELFILSERELLELEGISTEQMEMIKAYISDMLDANIKEAENFLQSLQSGKNPCSGETPEEPKSVTEIIENVSKTQESVTETAESVSNAEKVSQEQIRRAEEIEPPVKSLEDTVAEAKAAGMSYGEYVKKLASCTGATRKLTVGELENELAAGLSIGSIARKYGYCSASTIMNAISKHGINVKTLAKESPYRLTKEDIPQIREFYTEGSKNMTETAAILGVNKKTFKAFVDENHLTKKAK